MGTSTPPICHAGANGSHGRRRTYRPVAQFDFGTSELLFMAEAILLPTAGSAQVL